MASLDKSDGPPFDDLLWDDNGKLYYIGRRTYRTRHDQACPRCDRRRAREVVALKRNASVTHLCNVGSYDSGYLAACGELALLQRTDDLGGGESFGGLSDGCETVHGGIKHGLGLDESEYFLVEKGFEQCGGDNASG
jgi:hypothetical protein